jgi:ubiquinone/menaquinone biosynthesis C-methylase UbiE
MASINLGTPTQYHYSLPKIRYRLSRRFLLETHGKLLDYGCGNGANTVLFRDDFRNIIGVEVEKERLREARQFTKQLGISNIEYSLYDGSRLSFPSSYFDAVICFEVLEHTDDDRQSINDIHRVLKKKGLFILSVPNKWYLMETHGFSFPLNTIIPSHRIPFLSWLPDSIHSKYAQARIYTKYNIFQLLTEHSFIIKFHTYLMPPFDKVKNPTIKNILKKSFSMIERTPLKLIGVSHFIVAQKL